MELPDGGFQAGKEGFTGLAATEMLFQSFAERIIQAFIKIVRKLSEEGFTGAGTLGG